MSCTATHMQLLDLPVQQFGSLAHLRGCADCASIAREIEAGSEVLRNDLDAFVATGDFDAAFAAASSAEVPAVSTLPIHGMLIAVVAAAVLTFVAKDVLPTWIGLGNQAGLTPALDTDDLEAFDLVDESQNLEPDDLTLAEWQIVADDLLEQVLDFPDDDPASFEVWLEIARVANIIGDTELVELAIERAAQLSDMDPGLLELVDDPSLKDRIQHHFRVSVEVINPSGSLVEVGKEVIDGSDASIWVERSSLPVRVAIDGVPCGNIHAQRSFEIRADELVVSMDGGRSEAGCQEIPTRRFRAPEVEPVRRPIPTPVATPIEAVLEVEEKVEEAEETVEAEIELEIEPEEVAEPASPCGDLVALEPSSLLGRLTGIEIACLQGRLTQGPQTERDRVSRMLLLNTWALGDMEAWWKLAEAHLDQFVADPELAYLYARYLAKSGMYREAIHWGGIALDRRRYWVGERHVKRVYQLQRLRAICANQIWIESSQKHMENASDHTRNAMWEARSDAKVLAREWVDHARASGLPHSDALTLCASTAGTIDYCE